MEPTAVPPSSPSAAGISAEPDGSQHTEDSENQAAKIGAKIATFVPLSLRGEALEVLGAVMPTARQYVARAKPGDLHEVRRFMRAVAELLVERVKSGETLDPEIDLHPDYIDYFVNTICADDSRGLRHERQWVLTLIGQQVVPHLHPAKRRGVGRHRSADPFAPHEEEAFLLVAVLRCDLGWPGDAWVVVAVLGAGMKGPEARAAQPSDLFDLGDGGLGVQVTGRSARVVPIRKPYVDLAHAVLEAAGDGPFIADAGRNAVHKIASRIAVDGGPSFSLVRSRQTWIKAHLVAGTNLAALRKIAGPVSMNVLTHLLGSAAEEISDEEALTEGLRA